jgi:REP element-mobilizing transposase RayT
MPQSLSVIYLHLVFSTKNRQPFLSEPELRREMHQWLAAASFKLGCASLIVGGVEDHVHILATHGRTISQADWVKELKRTSSIWIKERDAGSHDFAWQAGYGVFGVAFTQLEAVQSYISNQERHHYDTDFKDEFRMLLREHGETWDERYVWD